MITNKLRARVKVLCSSLMLLALLMARSSNGRAQAGVDSQSANAEPAKPEESRLNAGLNRTRLALANAAQRVRAPETTSSVTSGLSVRSGLPETLGSRGMMTGPAGAPATPVLAGAVHSKFSGRRDPFGAPPPPSAGTGGMRRARARLPGKQGLVISQLRLEGIVREQRAQMADAPGGVDPSQGPPDGMIAVVTNSTNIAYFLHENDALYDGRVKRIGASSVDFEEEYLDAEGRVKTRAVVRQLGAALEGAR